LGEFDVWRCTPLQSITTPLLLDWLMNGASIPAYVERVLAPPITRRDIVIIDNGGLHKVIVRFDSFGNASATLLYLPPYSPD
jgi:transposase